MQDHQKRCPNEVNPDNVIDRLKLEEGYSKEIRKRSIIRIIRHAKKLECLLSPEELEASKDGRYVERKLSKQTNGNSHQEVSDGPERSTLRPYNPKELHIEGAGLLNLRRKLGIDGHEQPIKKTSLVAPSLLLLQGDDIEDTKF